MTFIKIWKEKWLFLPYYWNILVEIKKIISKIWKNLINRNKSDNPNIFSFDEDICIVEGNHKIYNFCISEPFDKIKRKKTFYQKNNVINNNWN